MTVLDDLRGRGHVAFAIRPGTFTPDRVPLVNLEGLLRRVVVQLRGWDLPHIDPHEAVQHKADHIEQDSAWNNHLEHWELYTSGQFADVTSIRSDWLDRSDLHVPAPGWRLGGALPIADTVITLTEIFELAARLAVTPAGDRNMELVISYRGMAGRSLVMDDPRRVPLSREYRYDDDRIDLHDTFSREKLAADAWDLAAEWATRLFGSFGWATQVDVIRSVQNELRGTQRRAT